MRRPQPLPTWEEITEIAAEHGIAHLGVAPADLLERAQAEMRTMVWASPHIEHNYYRNDNGEVHGLNPFRFVDYWTWTRSVDPDDHRFA